MAKLETVTFEEHYVQVNHYQNIIKSLQNDIYNLKMKDTANQNFIKNLEAKLENLNNNQILT
tara:strand:- start:515 stop:700 length:186 start_codon:yes stop_codon:yes gene_type:complete